MDEQGLHPETTTFTYQFSSTKQYGAPTYDAENEVPAAPVSSSSSSESRKKVDVATSTSNLSSVSAYQEKTRGLFHLDRVAVWAAGFIVVASLVVCVMAIFVTRYVEVTTTTLGPPIDTEDPLVRLSAWDKGEIKLVYGWTPPQTADITTSPESNLTGTANSTDLVPETYSEDGPENSTEVAPETYSEVGPENSTQVDPEVISLDTSTKVTSEDSNGTTTMPQNSTLASPQVAFLVEEPQQPAQNNA
ncbi:uncharacterized protein LOC144107017 isoform X2 [Amblyomma americanum]